jgi:hypothetical protein
MVSTVDQSGSKNRDKSENAYSYQVAPTDISNSNVLSHTKTDSFQIIKSTSNSSSYSSQSTVTDVKCIDKIDPYYSNTGLIDIEYLNFEPIEMGDQSKITHRELNEHLNDKSGEQSSESDKDSNINEKCAVDSEREIAANDAEVDLDDDGLSNFEEYNSGYDISPMKADTDDDGYSDKVEIDKGTDPTNPNEKPGSSIWLYIIIVMLIIAIVLVSYFGYKKYQEKKEEKQFIEKNQG